MQLGEIESYLCVASEFCTRNTYYFYNRGGKGSTMRLKEGLCRLRGEGSVWEGASYLACLQEPSSTGPASDGGSTLAGVSSASLLGALGGDVLSSRSVLCAGWMLALPCGRGASGVGGLWGHPFPSPVPSPVVYPFWAQGSWLIPTRGSEMPSLTFFKLGSCEGLGSHDVV